MTHKILLLCLNLKGFLWEGQIKIGFLRGKHCLKKTWKDFHYDFVEEAPYYDFQAKLSTFRLWQLFASKTSFFILSYTHQTHHLADVLFPPINTILVLPNHKKSTFFIFELSITFFSPMSFVLAPVKLKIILSFQDDPV